ncbi:MAG: methyltransferase [Acidimicrobiaceae bacterium]|jgi:putative Mg2+ transporter-C (MgtC) family protein|nr:methyltransferase [Acidimicrobiaceae bacterium]MDP6480987.1 MgtC/SapB family protein [Acidimicrobiales bacterium]|tara:strand:+ start:11123 stop:11800 length:678 start_codon:yes stop_codon:yes gene_type:complete
MLGAMTAPTELELVARLALAVALGAVLGLERETRHKTAGLRTHTLVALGAALFTIAGAFAVTGDQNDPSRVAAQVVTGIGFIGAGAMIRSGVTITGITTAATLWMAAAFGVAAGMGLYVVSVASGAMALIVVLAFGPLKPYVLSPRSRRRLDIGHLPGSDVLDALIASVGDSGGRLSVIETADEGELRRTSVVVWGIATPQLNSLLRRLSDHADVIEISPPPPTS